MPFKNVIGQNYIKNYLIKSAKNQRIPHAQLFLGNEGCGTLPMAIAYAELLLCSTSKNKKSCALKCSNLQHPDLHFAFPVTTNQEIKKKPISNLFMNKWRSFIAENSYGSLFNWLQFIGVENKQGIIGKDEAEDIVKKLTLKSFEGGFKVMIIWMAEKMNEAASNKLLKLIEEPPEKTVFILIAEDEEQIISTIKSRCQFLNFKALSEQNIAEALKTKFKTSENEAQRIAHLSEGNFNKAILLTQKNTSEDIFEQWFVVWVRSAFKAKGNPAVIQNLIEWSETLAKTGRETQKQFLQYCLQFFRQAMLLNFGAGNLVFFESKTGFQLEKFAPFVHNNNILSIEKELNDAQYHIERNGNAKIILLDLSIKLTRLLHAKKDVS